MSLAQYSKEELLELSLIEMAYEYLKNSKQPISFNELVQEIRAAADISEQEMRSRLAQFYTDINIDGRFLSLGENRWGLRVWYPVDTQEEEVVTVIKPKKKKKAKKVVDEDELDVYDEADDEDYDDFEEDDILEDEDELDDLDDIDEIDDDDEVLEDDEDFELDEEEELDEELELDEEEEEEEEEEL